MIDSRNGYTHECACRNCEPALAVQLADAPDRFSVKYGGHKLHAFRGNEDISKTCWQLIVGPRGSAWRFSEPVHPCETCKDDPKREVCAYIDFADSFRVEGIAR